MGSKSDTDILKKSAVVDEILMITNVDQRKRILKECLSCWGVRSIRSVLEMCPEGNSGASLECLRKRLRKVPKRQLLSILSERHNAATPEQLAYILKTGLLGLTRPEFKRVLGAFAGEIKDFNRLIRELGGRTVVPYEID